MQIAKAIDQQADRHRKAGDLRRGTDEQGYRCRRALVYVRQPHVKWYSTQLETQPDDDESQREAQQTSHA